MTVAKQFSRGLAIALSLACSQAFAGAFIGADANNPNLVLHPSNYTGSGGDLTVNVCISPASAVTTQLEIPVQNVIDTYNELQATTGNLLLGGNNDIPSGQLDAESVLLHEAGHCIGLAHVNLATESGLTGANRDYTKTTTGNDGNYDLGIGADNVRGSSDDLRDDDLNLHWFRLQDNNPFVIDGVVDSSTYGRNIGQLPSGNFAANASREVANILGFPNTEAAMQQGQFVDEAQRTLAADDVATVLYGASGVDEIAGTSDDYNVILNYRGVTSSNCDITVTVDNNTGFASCSVNFGFVGGGDHYRITNATVRLNDQTNWFYNQTPNDPPNMSPDIDPIADVMTSENQMVQIAVIASDPDAADTLTLSTSGLPGFCSLQDNGDGTGSIDCTPGIGDEGTYTVTVTATDNGDPVLAANESFELEVLAEGTFNVVECTTPFTNIPDNSAAGFNSSISITDAGTILDVDIKLTVVHGFVSDLSAAVTHTDTTTGVELLDRAGIPGTASGCDSSDIDVDFDDEGDTAAEDLCAPVAPAISGAALPIGTLGDFDGEQIAGTWELNVADEAPANAGLLIQWCVMALVMESAGIDSDGDGVFDDVDNCTDVMNPGQEDSNGDGIGNICDLDVDNTCNVTFLDFAFITQPGVLFASTGQPGYDPDLDFDSNGLINFLDVGLFPAAVFQPPGPSANACVPGLGN